MIRDTLDRYGVQQFFERIQVCRTRDFGFVRGAENEVAERELLG